MRQMLADVQNIPNQLVKDSSGSVKLSTGLKPFKSGSVWMCQPRPGGKPVKIRVVLSVYHNNFDRYAVVSSGRVLCKDCGYINLKTCSVTKLDACSLQVTPKDGDAGSALTFSVSTPTDTDAWMSVLDNGTGPKCPLYMGSIPRKPLSPLSSSPKNSFMPALTEELKEEDEESEE